MGLSVCQNARPTVTDVKIGEKGPPPPAGTNREVAMKCTMRRVLIGQPDVLRQGAPIS